MNSAHDRRRRELAAIHIGASQLGMDTADKNVESDYRRMLWSVARVRSAMDLDDAGRKRVLDHLRACGARFKRSGRPMPAADREAMVRKIRALAGSMHLPDHYLDGMSKKMFGTDRFEWLRPEQLRKLIAALEYHRQRHSA